MNIQRFAAVIVLGLAFGVGMRGGTEVSAASPPSSMTRERAITISPASVDLVVEPGGVYHGEFQVINQGKTEYTFKTYALPYGVTGETYQPGFLAVPGILNTGKWFALDTEATVLGAKKTKTVRYTISVPLNAKPGGYYAVVFAQTQVQATAQGVTPNHRVGEIFYLKVAGDVRQSGRLLSWDAAFRQSPPLLASLRLENNGGSHFASAVHVEVQDIFGSSKHVFDTEKYVLPQTVRKVDVRWDKTPSIGLFKVTGTVSMLDNTQKLPAKYVVVMPDSLVFALGALAGLAALLFIARVVVLRRKPEASSE